MYPCVVHEARVQTGAKDGGSWKSRLYEIQRPEKIIPRPLPRRPFKAATQLRNFVYCVVCKRLRIAEVKSGEDSIFFLFSFPSSFQVWPSFALWPVYVRVGFIKSYSYHLVAFIQWRIPLLKQKKILYSFAPAIPAFSNLIEIVPSSFTSSCVQDSDFRDIETIIRYL